MSDMHMKHRKELAYEEEELRIVVDSRLEAEDKP